MGSRTCRSDRGRSDRDCYIGHNLPKRYNKSNEMPFTIACDTDIDEVNVHTTSGIDATL